MYYLIAGGSLILFVLIFFLLKFNKKVNESAITPKIIACVFMAIFAVRYYFYIEYSIDNIVGLSKSPLSPVLTVFALIAIWVGAASNMVMFMNPFFNFKFTKIITKYFCLPCYIFMFSMLPFSLTIMMGPTITTKPIFSSVMYSIEVGMGLALCVWSWVKDFKFDKPGKKWYNIVFAVLAMLLCTIPSYSFQILFGYGKKVLIDNLTETHRIFIYMAFVIPVLIYLALRDKDKSVIRYAMVYMNVALMITFCTRYRYDSFLKPWVWPLHLCNTAMFILAICVVFNMKKVFYFTYFINVMGAFFAMVMPSYETTSMFQWSFVNFWVNHYPAFFMPLLLVALKVFERPKIKQFYYSMAAFAVYFVFVLICNAWFSNYDESVDFFFLNSTFIAEKLGTWAEKIFGLKLAFNIGNLKFVFHPLYQALFFLVYVGIALGIWFVYSQFYVVADSLTDLRARKKAIRLDKFALKSKLDGRSIEEPMDKDAGIKLELKNFSKKYATSKVYAVKDANLEVHGGEIFGFLGPNGAGKSTIIKSIVGIQPITEGAISVCGYDCATQPREAKAQIGFVPDHYALYEKLTGREYINYIADIYDVSKEDRTKRIEEMVSLFELEGSFDNSMKTYSHGMKQKITIMAALVHNPKLWILDEPLTGLDPNSIFQVKECMRRHAENGNIVFFSSHIIDVVERICTRIAIIKKGNILCTKTVEEIEKECPLEEFYLKNINDEQFVQKVLASEGK